MTDLHNEVQRAQWAAEILGNSLWKEAQEHIQASLLDKMSQYHSDPQACQEVALMKVISDRYVGFFEEIKDTGKMAAIQLEAERKAEERQTRLRAIPGA